ncbi:MAG: NUDIX domain-containing protein [Bacteroidetes bacterium]|nr:NUDIX domain-containing protein [Bacteroidota bacterium]MBX7044566.1 NUDIX domain-containing protein [Ignavibacteria bacterium]
MKIVNDKSIGVIVFIYKDNEILFLLVKHAGGHWAFPKGHPDKHETEIQTARRELREETGINNVELISDKILLEDRYKFTGNKGELIHKTVYYYIGEVENGEVVVDGQEISEHKWCTLEESFEYLIHSETLKLINNAFKIIYEHKNQKAD